MSRQYVQYQPKEGDGSLFQNDRKKTDRHPDWTGQALINGVRHNVAGWNKARKNGQPWLSLRIEPWRGEQREELPASKPEPAKVDVDTFDDSVPF